MGYIKAKLGVLVPSQVRALRIKSDMPRQADLARAAGLQQSRVSFLETPGAANVTLETLARLAATFRTGLVVKFVPFSEMLRWENDFSQDHFDVERLEDDIAFMRPDAVQNSVSTMQPLQNQLGGTSKKEAHGVASVVVGSSALAGAAMRRVAAGG